MSLRNSVAAIKEEEERLYTRRVCQITTGNDMCFISQLIIKTDSYHSSLKKAIRKFVPNIMPRIRNNLEFYLMCIGQKDFFRMPSTIFEIV